MSDDHDRDPNRHGNGRFVPGHSIRGVYPGPGLTRRNGDPPQHLDDALIDRLAGSVRAGLSMRGACGLHGVVLKTFTRWRQRGEAERLEGLDTPYARLSLAIDYARGEQELELVDGAKTGALPERVCMFLLERRFPDYQLRTAVEVDAVVAPDSSARERIEAKLMRALEGDRHPLGLGPGDANGGQR